MPYDNDYNQKLSNDINSLNRNYVLNEDVTLSHPAMARFSGSGDQKLEGGFLGALAGAVLPMILNSLSGKGKMKDCECESIESLESEDMNKEEKEGKGMSGGAIYNKMRDKMEGMGKASKDYKKQSEDKYMCGLGMSGGSAFGAEKGSVRDTGEGVTVPKNISVSGGKKRGRKSKMGSGLSGGVLTAKRIDELLTKLSTEVTDLDGLVEVLDEMQAEAGEKKKEMISKMTEHIKEMGYEKGKGLVRRTLENMKLRGGKKKKMEGAGIISDLGIPVISGLAGMFGLGKSGGARGGENPIKPEKFYPKRLGKTAVSADKSVPKDVKPMLDQSQLRGSTLSGLGKSGGKKSNPWLDLVKKVRDEHKELKGIKEITAYIKKNNLYKK